LTLPCRRQNIAFSSAFEVRNFNLLPEIRRKSSLNMFAYGKIVAWSNALSALDNFHNDVGNLIRICRIAPCRKKTSSHRKRRATVVAITSISNHHHFIVT